MNIIFMGTPEFSVPSLEALVGAGHNIQLVVTQPDKPFGRGKKIKKSEVKEKAELLSLNIFQPTKIKDDEAVAVLKELKPDLIVVIAYGQILSKEILDIPKYGCINVHASLLPKLRGAAPINWGIINGDSLGGITTMLMDVGLDTGDMLLKKEVAIENEFTAKDLHDKLKIVGADLLLETVDLAAKDRLNKIKQIDEDSTYAPMLNKEVARIDWNEKSKNIYNKIRGLNPDQVAFFSFEGNNIKIYKSSFIEKKVEFTPGTVVEVDNSGICVSTADGIVVLEEIQFPGKNKMKVVDFLRGNRFPKNIIL